MEYASRVKQIGIYYGKRDREYKNSKGVVKTVLYTFFVSLFLLLICGSKLFKSEAGGADGSSYRYLMLICICIFYGLFNSIETVCNEREIIKHEHRSGMYISSYILGNLFFDFNICLIHATVTWAVVTVRFFTNIIGEEWFLIKIEGYWVTMLLVTFASDAMGLMVSSVVKNAYMAMKVMPFVLILQVGFAGIFKALPDLVRRISSLTLSKWGVMAINDIVFGSNYIPGDNDPFFTCWMALLLMTVVFIAISIIILQSVDKDER